MSATTHLQLPFLVSGQAQKHVTVNESLLRLDALVQCSVKSRTASAQPAGPADGDLYILPAGKTGANWGGMGDGALAYYRDGVWEQITPREGWTAYVCDEDQHVAFSGASWGPILSAGFRNRLLNAAFAINQRGVASNADDTYCFDRWYVLTQSGAIAASALTDPETGRPSGIRLTQSQASAQRIGLAQIVESANIRDLRGAAGAMAARVRCSSSQAIRIAILEWVGTADAVTSDVVNSWTSTVYTPSNFFISAVNVIAAGAATPAANTWTHLPQITGVFGASLNNAIVMVWTEGAMPQNATLDLDQVQLEPGPICGAFTRRLYGEELALCERYFEKGGFDTAAAPAAGATAQIYVAHAWSTGTATVGGIAFKARKRASPAIACYRSSDAGAAASGTWNYLIGGWAEGASAAASRINVDSFSIDIAKTATFAAGSSYLVGGGWAADAEL